MSILRFIHAHDADRDEVEELVTFAFDGLPAIKRTRVAVRVHERTFAGYAAKRGLHRDTKWAGRSPYAVSLGIGNPDRASNSSFFMTRRICGHSSIRRTADLMDKIRSGELEHVGRWPVYMVRDWREHLVRLTAHEAYHVLQLTREKPFTSEVRCERYAHKRLEEWRALAY